MINSSSTKIHPQIVDIDDEVEICRDDRCSGIGIHAKHDKPFRKRGPRSKRVCPKCKEPLARRRRRGVITRFCEFCGFTPTDTD